MAEDPVIYAIADTHLGLNERGENRHQDSPSKLAGFLRWLGGLHEGKTDTEMGNGGGQDTIPVLAEGKMSQRTLLPPSHLILLGDILELWDAENRAVLFSSMSMGPILENLSAKKVYVLGNHDIILEGLEQSYPFGLPDLEVVGEVYPKPSEGTEGKGERIEPMTVGDDSYIFVHGHQFDSRFRGVQGPQRFVAHLRQFGAALGNWAFTFLPFSVYAIYVLAGSWFLWAPLWAWLMLAISFLVWFPRSVMLLARGFWGRFGNRYDRARTLEQFGRWWKSFRKQFSRAGRLGLVYGHTHLLDYVHTEAPGGALQDRTRARRLVGALSKLDFIPTTLYNISSWVSKKGRHETVIWASFFYADALGPLILGWDWSDPPRPFHIPFPFIEKLWRNEKLSSAELKDAEKLEWPKKVIQKWQGSQREA